MSTENFVVEYEDADLPVFSAGREAFLEVDFTKRKIYVCQAYKGHKLGVDIQNFKINPCLTGWQCNDLMDETLEIMEDLTDTNKDEILAKLKSLLVFSEDEDFNPESGVMVMSFADAYGHLNVFDDFASDEDFEDWVKEEEDKQADVIEYGIQDDAYVPDFREEAEYAWAEYKKDKFE